MPSLSSIPFLCILTILEASPNSWGALGADDGIFTVKLDKQHVPVIRGDRIVAYKTAHFGTVYIGFPHQQEFSMVFDTGSAHILVPSTACTSGTCNMHRQYDYRESASAVPLTHGGLDASAKDVAHHDRLTVTFGSGEISGPFVSDVVCLVAASSPLASDSEVTDVANISRPPKPCVNTRIIHAMSMSDQPFGQFKFDGVFGLGLPDLSVTPEFNLFDQMIKTNKHLARPRFGIFLSRDDSFQSEISFGGHDDRRMASELTYVPVIQPELGYWQIEVRAVRIGHETMHLCEDGACVAILDTGTSLFGVPKFTSADFNRQLARLLPPGSPEPDCRSWPGPSLVFELADGFEVSFGPEDYSRPAPLRAQNTTDGSWHEICRAALLPVQLEPPLGNKVFIFGEPFLKKYYTAYDFVSPSVGFAKSVQPAAMQPHMTLPS